METLGHGQISITMNTYSHVMPALGVDAAEKDERCDGAHPDWGQRWGQKQPDPTA
jgi:hypothetical protein